MVHPWVMRSMHHGTPVGREGYAQYTPVGREGYAQYTLSWYTPGYTPPGIHRPPGYTMVHTVLPVLAATDTPVHQCGLARPWALTGD